MYLRTFDLSSISDFRKLKDGKQIYNLIKKLSTTSFDFPDQDIFARKKSCEPYLLCHCQVN